MVYIDSRVYIAGYFRGTKFSRFSRRIMDLSRNTARKLNSMEDGVSFKLKSVLQDYAWGSHFEVMLHPCNY